MANFNEFDGIFICQTCKKQVQKIRLYKNTLDLTWICEDKHLSKVNLAIKGY